MGDVLSAILFLFPLIVSALMAWAAWRHRPGRVLWGWLAAGWLINLAGNVAWAAHDVITGSRLPPLSWVDLIYLLRYVCVALALWFFPTVWPRRRLWEVGGVLLLAALCLWVCVYRTELANTQRAWNEFLGVAIYPVLDASVIYLILTRWREVDGAAGRGTVWQRTLLLLLVGAGLYGAANLINFFVRMALPDAASAWADRLWFLNDVLACLAAAWFLWDVRQGRLLEQQEQYVQD